MGRAMEISHPKRVEQHRLLLDKATQDALADYCRARWPTNTAKLAAREWGLTLDEARGVAAARASKTTIDRIWKHPKGEWAVALAVLAEVIGRPVEAFIEEKRKQHADNAQRLGALVFDWSAGRSFRADHDPGVVGTGADRRDNADRRVG